MEAGISGSKRGGLAHAGHLRDLEKFAAFSHQVIGFSESATEVDEAIWLRRFWVAQRFSAALGDSLGSGLQPLRFYPRQHAEG